MQNRIHIFIAALLTLVASHTASAYDFETIEGLGDKLYLNIIGPGAAELTCKEAFAPTPAYTGTLTIPATVAHHDGTIYTIVAVGDRAFQNCASLECIHLPEGIEYIGNFAFAGCSSLSEFAVPSGLMAMGTNVFDGCFALTSFTGSCTTYSTAAGVLYDNQRTTCVSVPQSAEGAFRFAPNTEAIAPTALYGCSYIDKIEFPDNLRTIGDNAFYFCGSLEHVQIPASVESIGRCAFGACASLSAIDVDPANTHYASEQGVLYSADRSTLIQAPCSFSGNIDERTCQVGEMAFLHNHALTDIILPAGLSQIHTGAFVACRNAVTAVIPSSVGEIGPMAFGLCDSLRAVYVHAADPAAITVSADAFEATGTARRTLYVPKGSAGAYASTPAWSEFDEIIEYEHLAEQSIVWDTNNDIVSADSLTYTLSATATSDLDIEYTIAAESEGRAEIHGNTVKIKRAGPITVIAAQHGNAHFAPAVPVRRTLASPSGHDDIAISGTSVYTSGGRIIIECDNPDAAATVSDISGRVLYTGTRRVHPLPPHAIYLVNISGETFKVIL